MEMHLCLTNWIWTKGSVDPLKTIQEQVQETHAQSSADIVKASFTRKSAEG